MSELFPESEVSSLSPRLIWMRFYGVTLKQHDWTDTDYEGTDEPRWQALLAEPTYCLKWNRLESDGPCAETEDAALEGLALQMGWRLWNEVET